MQHATIYQVFESLGLSELEGNIYLDLIKSREVPVTELAKRYNTNRVRVYKAFENLEKLGLIERENDFSKITEVESPGRVLALLKDKENQLKLQVEKFEEFAPELTYSYEKSEKTPRVKIYEGIGQMGKLLLQTLEEVQGEYLWLNEGEDLNALFNAEYFFTEYSQKRAKKGIRVRILANTDNISIKRFDHVAVQELRQVRYLPPQYQSPGTITIYNDKMILWNTFIPRAIVIYDKQLAQIQRDIFEMLWQTTI
jgi:sugar-specific transcriptional regulator TrmB